MTYCNHGAFGTIVTKNTGDYATAGHTHTDYTSYKYAGDTIDSTENYIIFWQDETKMYGVIYTDNFKETEEEIRHLESISTSLDIALSESDLVQLKEELIEAGYMKRKGGNGKKEKKQIQYATFSQ